MMSRIIGGTAVGRTWGVGRVEEEGDDAIEDDDKRFDTVRQVLSSVRNRSVSSSSRLNCVRIRSRISSLDI